jgi:hypothetical protein
MRAWVSLRAAALPQDTNCSRSARSAAVKVTRYLSMSAILSLEGCRRQTAKDQGTAFTCQMKIDGPLARIPTLGFRPNTLA